MRLTCVEIDVEPCPIRPGRPERDWMNATPERFAYRCLPLSIANTSGWELAAPAPFRLRWAGGDRIEDLVVEAPKDVVQTVRRFAVSHFGSGVVTFHTGWLFRTDPGWGLWVRGAPNHVKDGIQALDGLVETDWLPFPFTMNWKMTRPGEVSFEAGEPIAFISPVPHVALDQIQPDIRGLDEEPELARDYRDWSQSRDTFLKRLEARDPRAAKEGWQRNYFRGKTQDGEAIPHHVSKRRLKAPIRRGASD